MLARIEIEFGEDTCASEPGKFCGFLFTKHFGTRSVCHLFGDTPLYDKDGWIQRCPRCVRTFDAGVTVRVDTL